MAVNGSTISVVAAGSLRCCSCFWSFMEFLLSSHRLDKEYHTLDYLRPFLWRELFHHCNLCLRTPLFDGFDEIMTSRCDRDALYPPITLVLASVGLFGTHTNSSCLPKMRKISLKSAGNAGRAVLASI